MSKRYGVMGNINAEYDTLDEARESVNGAVKRRSNHQDTWTIFQVVEQYKADTIAKRIDEDPRVDEKPAAPAPKFKVGDRVRFTHGPLHTGTVTAYGQGRVAMDCDVCLTNDSFNDYHLEPLPPSEDPKLKPAEPEHKYKVGDRVCFSKEHYGAVVGHNANGSARFYCEACQREHSQFESQLEPEKPAEPDYQKGDVVLTIHGTVAEITMCRPYTAWKARIFGQCSDIGLSKSAIQKRLYRPEPKP